MKAILYLSSYKIIVSVPAFIVATHNGVTPNVAHTSHRHRSHISIEHKLTRQDLTSSQSIIFSNVHRMKSKIEFTSERLGIIIDVILKVQSFAWAKSIIPTVP